MGFLGLIRLIFLIVFVKLAFLILKSNVIKSFYLAGEFASKDLFAKNGLLAQFGESRP